MKKLINMLNSCFNPEMFKKRYKEIYEGDENWKSIKVKKI